MAKQQYKVIVPSNELTEELAYWLGFLLADGNLRRQGQRSWQTRIHLAICDKSHLQKFLNFLQSDYPIYDHSHTNSCMVTITSEALGDLLMSYGITPRKSRTAQVDVRLADNRHFWRGVFDGDGYIGKDNPRFGFGGTQDVCEKFTQFLGSGLRVHFKCNDFYTVETCGKKAQHAVSTMYNNATIVLERKAILAGGYSYFS